MALGGNDDWVGVMLVGVDDFLGGLDDGLG